MKTDRNRKKAMTESEKKQKPFEGEMDPDNAFIELSISARRYANRYGVMSSDNKSKKG